MAGGRDYVKGVVHCALVLGAVLIVVTSALRTLGSKVDVTLSDVGANLPNGDPPAAQSDVAQSRAWGSERIAMAAADKAEGAPGKTAEPKKPVAVDSRKLIRTIDLEIVVQNTEETVKNVEELAARLGGYVSNLNGHREGDVMRYTMVVRVPAERCADAVNAIKVLGKRVDREGVKTDDVTDQYVDLEARERALRATEKELQKLLEESRERQHKMEDILRIYTELTNIRSQIEQIQGRLKMFDRLVAYSTINLTLNPDVRAVPIIGRKWSIVGSARTDAGILVRSLQAFVDVVLYVVIVLGVYILLLGGLAFVGFRIWRRWAAKTHA